MSLSDSIADWVASVRADALPQSVIDDAKLRIIDTIGVSTAAVGSTLVVAARAAALKLGEAGQSRILGYGDAISPAWAAMVNGTMAHALDLDDTHPGASIHVSAPVVSAAISLGDALGSSGADVLAAVVCGSEITARIGRVAPGAFHARGQHATGIVGTTGAAITVAKLLGLPAQQIRHAIGISVSQASGISESFGDGTWPRRLHSGWAAHSGIAAAYLAEAGFIGPIGALDGRFGLFKAFLGEQEQPYERLLADIGSEWFAGEAAFKPYPCGHVIQGFVDCMIRLYHDHGIRAANIERIVCRVSPWMIPLVAEPAEAKRRPTTESGAKGSLYFTVASAIMQGRLTASAYAEDRLAAAEVLALVDRVSYEPDPEPPASRRYKGWVTVTTTDGQTHEVIVPDSLGSTANPMSTEAIHQKIRDVTAGVLSATQVEGLISTAQRLETVPNVSVLVDHSLGDGLT